MSPYRYDRLLWLAFSLVWIKNYKRLIMYAKNLCKKCNLNGDCWCQNKSQKDVNNCGMEQVIAYNRKINTTGQNYDNPDYVDFMKDRNEA